MATRPRRCRKPTGRGLLGLLGLLGAPAALWAGPGGAALAQAQTSSTGVAAPRAAVARRPVVLILAEALDWGHAPAELNGFAHGSLSLHSAGSAQSDVDGFLTVNTGRRAVGLTTLTTLPPP